MHIRRLSPAAAGPPATTALPRRPHQPHRPRLPRLPWLRWLLARRTRTAPGPADLPLYGRRTPRTGGRRYAPGGEEDRPTLADLYRARRLDMVRLAVLLVDDQHAAEDIVQDAFAALHRSHGETLADLENAAAYLHTSVLNAARSVLRRRRTARAYVPPHEVPGAPVDERVLLADEHRRVITALGGLKRRQREVLVLRYWSELSETEIAEALGMSRGTVKSTASRALDALERLLETDG
ncbi:SigE family RNA polymerase sigma factor [Streptomyces sp. NPDC092296]|uniref:SigE family RNA polymerase sigma factor n=1 Tax=Streptomyces sp. NPDC092296 TaxID=3366012 RepID=UPI003827ABD9